MAIDLAHSSVGIGLRPAYYAELLQERPNLGILEVMTEDFLSPGGIDNYYLRELVQHYQVVMHGVSLSIAGTDGLQWDYLEKVKALADELSVCFISDHLCWTAVNGVQSHELLPFPFTEESLSWVVSRVDRVQSFLQRPLVLENVTRYVEWTESELTEIEFWRMLIAQTGCCMLLDINNLYINSKNLGLDPYEFLAGIPKGAVKQYHLAGFFEQDGVWLDTHDRAISDPVWQLYEYAWRRMPAPTIIERDTSLPPLQELLNEVEQVRLLQHNGVGSLV